MTNSSTPPLTTHDLTSELLLGMRLMGVRYQRIELAAPFGLNFGQDAGRAQFHFVGHGPVFLRAASGQLHRLETGDAALLPRGGEHKLLSSPGQSPCQDLAKLHSTPLCSNICSLAVKGSPRQPGTDALIFSGSMEFELGSMQMLVAVMPEVMQVGTLLARYPELQAMLDAMERESRHQRAGFAGILARLADVVSAFIVRGWVECGCGDASGWVEALRDPRLGKVLLALHRDPGRHWTVAGLAAEMGSSRSVFAERFTAITGMTPLRYLTELRMRLAIQSVSRDREPIESIALRLGYGSLAAFSRAFKRTVGHAPGAIRAQGEAAQIASHLAMPDDAPPGNSHPRPLPSTS